MCVRDVSGHPRALLGRLQRPQTRRYRKLIRERAPTSGFLPEKGTEAVNVYYLV